MTNNNTIVPDCQTTVLSSGDEQPKIIIHIAMGMVTLLSVCGILGNALAIFVFARQRNKLSSTVFILTLAVTDFITSLVTMPYTVVMELMDYDIGYDFPCKLYQFMKTTTIPFSAFVMVTIALDRYLCIVYPFKHIMTLKKAKIVVILLASLAFIVGILASLMIGTYHLVEPISNECRMEAADDVSQYIHTNDSFTSIEDLTNATVKAVKQHSPQIVHTGICKASFLIFGKKFMKIYQKIYSALFGICAVLVIVLYGLTYKSVLAHRSKRLNISNKCCGMMSNFEETTEFTTINREENSAMVNGNEESCIQLEDKYREPSDTIVTNTTDFSSSSLKHATEPQPRPRGVSRAKLKKLRVANIKTALMLSIVAFMYIIAFTPAWMMALGVLQMNVIVYYLYFAYNVANPVIYAFLNNNFRTHLQAMFRCKK